MPESLGRQVEPTAQDTRDWVGSPNATRAVASSNLSLRNGRSLGAAPRGSPELAAGRPGRRREPRGIAGSLPCDPRRERSDPRAPSRRGLSCAPAGVRASASAPHYRQARTHHRLSACWEACRHAVQEPFGPGFPVERRSSVRPDSARRSPPCVELSDDDLHLARLAPRRGRLPQRMAGQSQSLNHSITQSLNHSITQSHNPRSATLPIARYRSPNHPITKSPNHALTTLVSASRSCSVRRSRPVIIGKNPRPAGRAEAT